MRIDSKGSAIIILCLAVTVLLGFAAYALDIGMVYVEKEKLVDAADSAVLAAALELPNGDLNAEKKAEEYLQKNGVNPNDAVISINNDHKGVQITAVKNVKHVFAQIIGINSSNVNVKSGAIIAPANSITGGIRPFAVEKFDFSYGDIVTLKQGAGDGYHGNYGAVSLGGSGTSIFRQNALYGYSGKISVGDYIDTEPGDMAGACSDISKYINSESSTFNNFARNSIRIWTIPLVTSLLLNGQKSVQVIGFAELYVESVYKNAGKIQINGRFIKYVINSSSSTSLSDTGIYGVKLSK